MLIYMISIHPSSMPLILHRVVGSLEPIPGKAGDNLDSIPIAGQNHTHYGQFANASHSTTHVFGLRKETGVTRGNPEAWGKHANFAHTGPEVGFKPATPGVRGRCADP